MRKTMIAVAAAAVLGMATMTTGAMAFHGPVSGHIGSFSTGHIGSHLAAGGNHWAGGGHHWAGRRGGFGPGFGGLYLYGGDPYSCGGWPYYYNYNNCYYGDGW